MNLLTPCFFAAGLALPLLAAAQTTSPIATPQAAAAAAEGRLELALKLVFAFDRSWRSDIPEADRDQLDAMLSTVANRGLRVVAAKVTGQADRLDGSGDRAYNLRLCERRAATVRALLLERGVAATGIAVAVAVAAAGDAGEVEVVLVAVKER
jgi:outer membrane protein OmpA-like peptidoglycan-associated protein